MNWTLYTLWCCFPHRSPRYSQLLIGLEPCGGKIWKFLPPETCGRRWKVLVLTALVKSGWARNSSPQRQTRTNLPRGFLQGNSFAYDDSSSTLARHVLWLLRCVNISTDSSWFAQSKVLCSRFSVARRSDSKSRKSRGCRANFRNRTFHFKVNEIVFERNQSSCI